LIPHILLTDNGDKHDNKIRFYDGMRSITDKYSARPATTLIGSLSSSTSEVICHVGAQAGNPSSLLKDQAVVRFTFLIGAIGKSQLSDSENVNLTTMAE
jgi:hypothetical protein